MKIATSSFWQKNQNLFDSFAEVYLFGSSLTKEQPQDIDLVLVYLAGFDDKIRQACDAIREAIFLHFGYNAHLTVLSTAEKNQTQFLKKITALQIK